MARNKYVRYILPVKPVFTILEQLNKKRLNIFIDLLNICKGLYNKDNVLYELKYYIDNGTPSETLINEMREFLNNNYKIFRKYNPFFVIFYDDGRNTQNTIINNAYKEGRSSITNLITDDDELRLYKEIKKLYLIKTESRFTKENFGKVYYLKEYEADLIPYYCIKNNLYDSNESDTLNVILSNDKDLLQCCKFKNTIQCVNRFKPSRSKTELIINLYDNENAITYLYENFKRGRITAEHIPMILALSGDKADNIDGLKGIGYSKAIKLIEEYNLPTDYYGLEQLYYSKMNQLPEIIINNIKIILSNLKIIDFDLQLARTKI